MLLLPLRLVYLYRKKFVHHRSETPVPWTKSFDTIAQEWQDAYCKKLRTHEDHAVDDVFSPANWTAENIDELELVLLGQDEGTSEAQLNGLRKYAEEFQQMYADTAPKADDNASKAVKWAVSFDIGGLHRYSTEKIREKFDVLKVWVGMEVFHPTRGRGTVITSFDDDTIDNAPLQPELESEHKAAGQAVETIVAAAARRSMEVIMARPGTEAIDLTIEPSKHFAETGHKPSANSNSETNEAALLRVFDAIDKNGDGLLSRAEAIKAVRKDEAVATLLGLPQHLRQEDGSRDSFEELFQAIDRDISKSIERDEFIAFFASGTTANAATARVDKAAQAQGASTRLPITDGVRGHVASHQAKTLGQDLGQDPLTSNEDQPTSAQARRRSVLPHQKSEGELVRQASLLEPLDALDAPGLSCILWLKQQPDIVGFKFVLGWLVLQYVTEHGDRAAVEEVSLDPSLC